jgi:uncharacterized DUF497 family protein
MAVPSSVPSTVPLHGVVWSTSLVELDETADRNYDCPVRIEPDPAQSERNARSRGLSFELVAGFDWETAVYREDSRRAYPERCIVALGSVGPRLCVGAQASEGRRDPCFMRVEAGAQALGIPRGWSQRSQLPLGSGCRPMKREPE